MQPHRAPYQAIIDYLEGKNPEFNFADIPKELEEKIRPIAESHRFDITEMLIHASVVSNAASTYKA